MSHAVLIAGGGTGGHLFPGVAVAQELKAARPEITVAFVGAGRALEGDALARAGFASERLAVRAVRGAGLLGRIKALAVLPGAVLKARAIIKRYRPGLVMAVGGYAAFPLGVAAWLSGVPLAVQEQNAVPGLTNRMLLKLAKVVFAAFEQSMAELPPAKARFVGNPVRADLVAQARQAAEGRPENGEPFTLLILGGSQGAHSINQAMADAAPLLAERADRLRIIHQTGANDVAMVGEAYQQHGITAEVAAFFNDVGRCFGAAHLVLCRAGAGTLTEAAAVGRAVVAVPYPHAAGDHQTHNARAMEAAGAAKLIVDRDLDGAAAAGIITALMDDHPRRQAMEAAALAMAKPEAATEIANVCLALMKEAA